MKKIITITASLFCLLNLGNAQILDLIYADKYDFQDVLFETNTGFDPLIMFSDSSDLSHYNVDFDPMGIISGSIFFADGGETEYAGSFFGDSDVRLLDVHFNEEVEHQTILLDLNGPCSFVGGDEDTLNFHFPLMDNMTGIINFSDESGMDSFWSTYILATEKRYQHLWSVGDLTLISGSATENELQYVNPDKTIQDIEVFGGYNHYIIAIDKFGFYQWSYVNHGSETLLNLAEVRGIEVRNNEMTILVNEVDLLDERASRLIYLDFDGNEVKAPNEFKWVFMDHFEMDDDGGMVISGSYNVDAGDTNMDLNGGELFLESSSVAGFNGFVIKYDGEGNAEWARTLDGEQNNFVTKFAKFSDHIYFTGLISQGAVLEVDDSNTMSFDDVGEFELFVSKFSEDGTMVWTVPFGNENFALGRGIVFFGDEIGLFGSFVSDIDIDPNSGSESILTNENPDLGRSHFFAVFDERPLNTIELENKGAVLRPNPVSTYLDTGDKNITIAEIKDITGRVVGRYNSSNVDVSNLKNGMYVVTLDNNGTRSTELISVMH